NNAFRILDLNNVNLLYSDYNPETNKELLWISTDKGLVIYDPEIILNQKREYAVFIRNVMLNHDSSIYNGTSNKSNNDKTVLPFKNNNILNKISAASYTNTEANLYQYYLERNDEEWSQWTTESSKEYTNLSSGDYVFRVRAKNVYGIIGTEDTFAFRVLGPWYFSWWAYFIYGAVFIWILYLI